MPIMFTHFTLVADIGGTNIRFGLVDARQTVTNVISLRCADFNGPVEAALAYLEQCAFTRDVVRQAAFAVASAVLGDTITLTNNHWSFDRSDVKRALGLEKLLVLNDFEALALSLPALAENDYQVVGAARPAAGLPMAVIGPGTGLGVAGVVPCRNGWVAIPGEGSHATLAAADDFEAEILRAARGEFSHVSAERLLSGIGLPVLLRAVCVVQGVPRVDLSSEQISALGASGSDPQCRTTMELFFAFLGGFAGNIALAFGARGGIFIGGGIVPNLTDFLLSSRFRERFEAKGRFQPYLADIATAIITAPYAALRGLAGAMSAADSN
ncbi:MAG: glucokinase [Betaproteobacteria bacterium]|nr:glucokinase [Betaproteobacteria bacterium]